MKTITIIRHGESIYNAGEFKKESEVANCRLSDKGKIQSQSLDQSFDILIVSPLKRALETYVNSQIKTKELIISPLFAEHRNGKPLNYLENEEYVVETPDDLAKRAKSALQFVRSLPKLQQNIGIISHGDFLHNFLKECQQKQAYLKNTEAVTFKL